MATVNLHPFYRTVRDFDRLAERLAHGVAAVEPGPSYDITETAKNRYQIVLALPGWKIQELSVAAENGVLTVKGEPVAATASEGEQAPRAIHRGILRQAFERRFNLAEHVEVRGASLEGGLLTLELVREVPEALKPKTISISGGDAGTAQIGTAQAA